MSDDTAEQPQGFPSWAMGGGGVIVGLLLGLGVAAASHSPMEQIDSLKKALAASEVSLAEAELSQVKSQEQIAALEEKVTRYARRAEEASREGYARGRSEAMQAAAAVAKKEERESRSGWSGRVSGGSFRYRNVRLDLSQPDYPTVLGEIENTSWSDYDLVNLDIRLLDSRGGFVGSLSAGISDFKSGQKRTHEGISSQRLAGEPARVEMAVDGVIEAD